MLLIPDSTMAREAEQYLRAASTPALVNHCLRSYLWGTAIAEIDGVDHDPELLFVASALHDLGLETAFDSGAPFEEDGGRAAADFVVAHGWSTAQASITETAIVLHVAKDVSIDDGPESYLLWEATGLDVSGIRLDDVPGSWIGQVMKQYPRLDFPAQFSDLLSKQALDKPRSRAADLVRAGVLELLEISSLNPSSASVPADAAGTGRKRSA